MVMLVMDTAMMMEVMDIVMMKRRVDMVILTVVKRKTKASSLPVEHR